jgi:ATP-binding cassette subfamily B multidrug efflux pump
MSDDQLKKQGRFDVILKYLRGYKSYLVWGGVAIIGANVLILLNPYLLKVAFDKLEQRAPSGEILQVAALMILFAIISGVFRFSTRRTIVWMSRKMEYDLRSELFSHLLKLSPSFYHDNRTGDIMARMTNDIEAVRMMVGPGIMHIANTII